MTPTISPRIQQKLTESEFNDGYLMLTRLQILLQPTGSSEFMRLSKEYYTLQFKAFKTVPDYLTHIKVLEEKIDATKVVLDTNNRTILCLSMSLPQEYQYLVQIWAVTPAITAEKARQMVLEASRQHNQASQSQSRNPTAFLAGSKCTHYGSTNHPKDKCFLGNPKIAPEWFKIKMKEQAKGKGKPAEQAQDLCPGWLLARRRRMTFRSKTSISQHKVKPKEPRCGPILHHGGVLEFCCNTALC